MANPQKSQTIQDLEAALYTPARVAGAHGRLRIKTEVVTLLAAGSAIADVHRYLRFKSGDAIHAIHIYSDGGGAAGDADLGLYLADDGAVIDANLFATAFPIDTATAEATTALPNSVRQSNVAAFETTLGEPLWEVAGRGAGSGSDQDPFEEYDLAFTLTAAITGDTIVGIEVIYTSGD